MVQKFRKKTRPFEAIQYTGHNGRELEQWSNGAVIESPVLEPSEENPTGCYIQIKTLKGVWLTAIIGDWIGKDITGDFFSQGNQLFEELYEPVKNQ